MKTTRIFAAALALLSVLSCQKEEQRAIGNSENEGGAIITCTFANNDATKTTTTDGKTPLWVAEDKIMLYDGVSNTQELTLAASGETPSSTQGVIDGTDATKFTFVRPSGWTNVYAIYPYSACVTSFSASDPKINFAGQDGTFAKANICAAVESDHIMAFKNVGAILKFVSKSVKLTKIVVPVAGLANNFKVSFSGDTPSLASESASNSNEFSIGTGSGAVYIGVPAGNIAASSVFTYKTSADAILGTYTTGAANTVEVNKVYNLGTMMGVLSGIFTVNGNGKKVQFSKGNLQATVDILGTPSSWNFAANQYSFIGLTSANKKIGSMAGTVDLFAWSTEAIYNNWGIHNAKTRTAAAADTTGGHFKDWGENAIVNGGNIADIWRTLTIEEWEYIVNPFGYSSGVRTGNNFAKAMVNGLLGLIVFPDGYTGTTSGYGIATVNNSSTEYPKTSIAAETWKSMESDGCIFLPAAGERNGTYMYYNIGDTFYVGEYASSSFYPYNNINWTRGLSFSSNSVSPPSHDKSVGYSVRLVIDTGDDVGVGTVNGTEEDTSVWYQTD